MWKIVFIFVCVYILCGAQLHTQPKVTPIPVIKDMLQENHPMTSDSLSNKKEFIVEGFFYKDPVPLLLTQLKWSRINTRMPDSVYLSLDGAPVEEMSKALDKYQGAFVRLRGVVNIGHKNGHKDLTVLESTFVAGAR